MSLISWPVNTRPAILYRSQKISYQRYEQIIKATILRLKSLGIKRGDRVAIVSPNCVEYLILLPALWRLGAISCHLSTRVPMPVLRNQIKKINCRILLSPKKTVSFKATSLVKQPSKVSLNQKTTILFTSGSTSEPKAVVHTYGNHYYNAKGSNENISFRPGDRWLLSLPLYHVSGLGILFRMITGGGAIVIPGNEDLISAIKTFKITHISLVTTHLYRLLQTRKNILALRKLKAILLGGSAIPPSLIKLAKKYRLPVYVSYGLTEMASQVATSTKPRSGAKILKYRQVKIVNDEILVKGKTLFCGYAKGKKLIRPFKDGWFATGDLGKLDNGYLAVLGRKDNMFISGGENIYPEEIERELLRLAGVTEAIVIPQADAEFGQRPVAFVKGRIKASRIISRLNKNLPRFKLPQAFYAWPLRLATAAKPQRQTFLNLLTQKHKLKKLA